VTSDGYRDLRGERIDPHAVVALHAQALFALRQVLDAARARGVPLAPVKGALTARWLYRSVAERPISDVDLRARPEDLDALASIAAENRWALRWRDRVYRSLGLVVEGVTFDVETWVGAPWMSSLTVGDMLSRAERTDALLGAEYSRLTVHDHALILALNVVKDRVGASAPWAIEDVARVAEAPGFDPAQMAELAWRAQNASVMKAVALWMERARGSRAWAAVARAIGAAPRESYVRAVTEALEARESGAIDRMQRRVWARSSCDDLVLRARALATMAGWLASPLAWPVLQRAKPRAR
jgi:hypothetical protein